MKVAALKSSLALTNEKYSSLPAHVAAFCAYLIADDVGQLKKYANLAADEQGYQKIAAAGFVLARDPENEQLAIAFGACVTHLSGRTFFADGRAPRFEVDAVALLGVALGISVIALPQKDINWFSDLLRRSSETLITADWQYQLVEVGRAWIDSSYSPRIKDTRLGIIFSDKKPQEDTQLAWEEMIARVADQDPLQIAVNRAVFDLCAASLAALPVNGAGIDELISILQGLTESMSHWTYEISQRARGSVCQQWEIDHEYHVQNLLWTVLRPVFSDLVDEQSLSKVGHKTPRYDLGIPSLKTIIEVKYMRRAGKSACRKITDEIAADRSLYLGERTGYSTLIAFIWDECRQTEEYKTLADGLESIDGIEKVIFLPRPSHMDRAAKDDK